METRHEFYDATTQDTWHEWKPSMGVGRGVRSWAADRALELCSPVAIRTIEVKYQEEFSLVTDVRVQSTVIVRRDPSD